MFINEYCPFILDLRLDIQGLRTQSKCFFQYSGYLFGFLLYLIARHLVLYLL